MIAQNTARKHIDDSDTECRADSCINGVAACLHSSNADGGALTVFTCYGSMPHLEDSREIGWIAYWRSDKLRLARKAVGQGQNAVTAHDVEET
jgi:hypothetical protein